MSPLPPGDLETRKPILIQVAAATRIHRFYTAAYEPIYFDRSDAGRLNDCEGKFGVLYAAARPDGAFVETFLRKQLRMLDEGFIAKKGYVELEVLSELTFIKLAGPGLARLAATAAVTHAGEPYDIPQQWSRRLHDLPLAADGIAYNARHDDEELCYAIFERAQPKVAEARRELDVRQDWFWDLMDKYDIGYGTAP